jgi:type I restriction enzyme S subunit
VVRTGNTGQVISGVSGCFHNNFFKINLNKELVDGRYLYHCLKTKEKYKEMLQRAGVTTIPDLNHFMFLDIEIPLPEKRIQIGIAKILDGIEEKINLNNKLNFELESMAKTIYDYWFVQFDFPDENGKPYKSSGGEMVWNEELKKEIPKDWSVDKVGNRLKSYLGGTPRRDKPEYWQNTSINWLSSGEVASFPITESYEKISIDGLNNSASKLLKSGTICISITGNIRVSITAIDTAINQSVVGIEEGEFLNNNYLYFYFKNYIPKFESLMTGAVQKHINKNVIECTPLIIPELETLKRYNELTSPIINMIINQAKENQKLAELRDFLLPLLMNGQTTIND